MRRAAWTLANLMCQMKPRGSNIPFISLSPPALNRLKHVISQKDMKSKPLGLEVRSNTPMIDGLELGDEIAPSESSNNQSPIIGVKISLTKKGCSGLAYKMDYIKEVDRTNPNIIHKFDEIIDIDGIIIVIDRKALVPLVGTKLDFVENELGSEFVFRNPNEKGRCGCGQSFHI